MPAPPSLTLRPAQPGDAPALGRLGAMLVALHHGFDARRFIAPGPGTEEGYGGFLVSELARAEAIVRVAEAEGGEVAGYVYAGMDGNDWMALRGAAGVIYDGVVDPARRGQGASFRGANTGTG